MNYIHNINLENIFKTDESPTKMMAASICYIDLLAAVREEFFNNTCWSYEEINLSLENIVTRKVIFDLITNKLKEENIIFISKDNYLEYSAEDNFLKLVFNF